MVDSASGKLLCLYHNDMDGRCSAAIVRRRYAGRAILHAIDYGDPIPWDRIDSVEGVLIIDFSLPKEHMLKIDSMTSLTWIDHHKTALSNLEDLSHVQGLRALDRAACVLTWQVFFAEEDIPRSVTYIGDRDIWEHAYSETRPFGEGIFHENTNPMNDKLWSPLLDDNAQAIEELIERGKVLHKASITRAKRLIAGRGFAITFEGQPTLALNTPGTGDLGELIRQKGYIIGYCYSEKEQNGKLTTSVTLYSDRVDVSEIAKKFGGGGHPGASGFSFVRNGTPFPSGSSVDWKG